MDTGQVSTQVELFLLATRVAEQMEKLAPHLSVSVPNHADLLVDDVDAGVHLIASTLDWSTVWRAFPYVESVAPVPTGLAPADRSPGRIAVRLVALLAD